MSKPKITTTHKTETYKGHIITVFADCVEGGRCGMKFHVSGIGHHTDSESSYANDKEAFDAGVKQGKAVVDK